MSSKILVIAFVVFSASSYAAEFAGPTKVVARATEPVAKRPVDNVPGGVNNFFTYNKQCVATLNSAKAITITTKPGKAVRQLIEDLEQVDFNIHQVTDSTNMDLAERWEIFLLIGTFTPSIAYNLEAIQNSNPQLGKKSQKPAASTSRKSMKATFLARNSLNS